MNFIKVLRVFKTIYVYIVPLFVQKTITFMYKKYTLFKKLGAYKIIKIVLLVLLFWHIFILIFISIKLSYQFLKIKTTFPTIQEVGSTTLFLNEELAQLQNNLNLFRWMPLLHLPYISNLLDIEQTVVNSIQHVKVLSNKIILDHKKVIDILFFYKNQGKDVQFIYTALTQEERYIIFEALLDTHKHLENYNSDLQLLSQDLSLLDTQFQYWGIDILKQESDSFKNFLSQDYEVYKRLSSQIAYFLGYPETFKALILIQNSNELRPTGGFIGTYGVLEMYFGQIQKYIVDNIYNIDKNTKKKILPPQAFIDHKIIDQWYLRDSNWSPDFKQSALNAIFLYNNEAEKSIDFNTVIAIQPGFIEKLLGAVGGLEFEGKMYNQDNFLDLVENHVGKEFLEKGINVDERKDILGQLASQLIGKVLKPNSHTLFPILHAIVQAFEDKDILLFSKNEKIQNFFQENNWDGNIQCQEYCFSVIDSNLGSMKTDAYITRKYKMNITQVNTENYSYSLDLMYRHNAFFNWKTTRYQNLLRVYLPKNAKNIIFTQAPYKIYDEIGYRVLETYIVTEPKTETNLRIMFTTESIPGLMLYQQPGKKNSTYEVYFNDLLMTQNMESNKNSLFIQLIK